MLHLNVRTQVWVNFFNWKLFKNDEKLFLFHSKALFVLKIFKFLSLIFGHLLNVLD